MERKRGRETSVCGCLSQALNWRPDLQPRHVPWLGIEPVTLWSTGWHLIHEPHQPLGYVKLNNEKYVLLLWWCLALSNLAPWSSENWRKLCYVTCFKMKNLKKMESSMTSKLKANLEPETKGSSRVFAVASVGRYCKETWSSWTVLVWGIRRQNI